MKKLLLNGHRYLSFFLLGNKLSRKQFKVLTAYLRISGWHRVYEHVLKRYDKKLSFPENLQEEGKTFTGRGYGANTLNTYRKVYLGGEPAFEKVYFKKYPDFKKCKYFYDQVRDKLQEKGIHTPELLSIREGKKLALMYFQYIDLPKKQSTLEQDVQRALSISQTLGQIEVESPCMKDAFLLDFESDPMVKKRLRLLRKKIRAEFREAGIEDPAPRKELKKLALQFLQDLKQGERILQHGDLYWDNFSHSHVIDWDRMGLYPFGYDLGLILAFYKLQRREQVTPEDILEEIAQMGYHNPRQVGSMYFFTVLFLISRSEPNQQNFTKLVAHLKNIQVNENTGLYA